jgi:hypothetical protein
MTDKTRIVISKSEGEFEVRVVDSDGRLLRRFTYINIDRARTAAQAWAAAYDNCPIIDLVK